MLWLSEPNTKPSASREYDVSSDADQLVFAMGTGTWVWQAENVVGWYNLYQHFGDTEALGRALRCWNYIKTQIIDRDNGEWHWSRHPDGTLNTVDDKAGFWKCPYHNSRMCLEIMERSEF